MDFQNKTARHTESAVGEDGQNLRATYLQVRAFAAKLELKRFIHRVFLSFVEKPQPLK